MIDYRNVQESRNISELCMISSLFQYAGNRWLTMTTPTPPRFDASTTFLASTPPGMGAVR